MNQQIADFFRNPTCDEGAVQKVNLKFVTNMKNKSGHRLSQKITNSTEDPISLFVYDRKFYSMLCHDIGNQKYISPQ